MSISGRSDPKDLLLNAKKHYFSLGVDDGASSLCKSNFQYGLAKIHFAQHSLGTDPEATFISTPDETISRNKVRWSSGYGYGGKLTTGTKKDPLLFVDTKPNACGMLVGGLSELPKPTEIIKRINVIISEDYFIDDVPLIWDFKKGNHFIDVFKTDTEYGNPTNFPPYMFVIHGSVPELRKETEKGPGLYYDESKELYDMCNSIQTPFGPIYYLDGTNAKEYFQFFQYAKKFAAEKRLKVAELLFGKFKPISNPMHQGLLNYGEILLGSQHITDNSQKLFPVALRSDLPLYLISALPNLNQEQIDDLGFENRAKRLGVLSHLQNFNVLPHGGGYALPHINQVKKVLEFENERYFVCEQETEDGITIFSDVNETQYIYRGKKIINKIEALGLGNIEAKLHPKYVLKI